MRCAYVHVHVHVHVHVQELRKLQATRYRLQVTSSEHDIRREHDSSATARFACNSLSRHLRRAGTSAGGEEIHRPSSAPHKP